MAKLTAKHLGTLPLYDVRRIHSMCSERAAHYARITESPSALTREEREDMEALRASYQRIADACVE